MLHTNKDMLFVIVITGGKVTQQGQEEVEHD